MRQWFQDRVLRHRSRPIPPRPPVRRRRFGNGRLRDTGLFSGLNNLEGITLDPAYGTICGYTDEDLEAVFTPELEGLDRDEVRRRYNGYSWLGERKVCNPFDMLRLFRRGRFGNHRFETGTPTFLIEMLSRKGLPTPALDRMAGSETLLSAFDVEHIPMEALLFRTGYLTITGEEVRNGSPHCRLYYPNLEVRRSLGGILPEALLPEAVRREAEDLPLRERMAANDLAWVGEDGGSRGRADMALRFNRQVYLFELKVADRGPEGAALA